MTGRPLYEVFSRNDGLDGMVNLAGLTEIGEMLGVSRQRAAQLAASKGFPKPLDRIASGPVWQRATVERWAQRAGRIS